MPDRILRTGILSSDSVNKLSFPAEVFYRRLMSVVDDYGRYDGRPGILRAQLYALKLESVTEPNVDKWIRECVEADLVRSYALSGRPYVEILKFQQRIRTLSKWPDPPPVCPQPAGNSPPPAADHTHTNSEKDDKESVLPGAREEVLTTTVPSILANNRFMEPWEQWRIIRMKCKKPKSTWSIYLQKQLDWLAGLGLEAAIAIVSESARNEWQGLFLNSATPVTNGTHRRSNTRDFQQAPDYGAIR